MKAFDNRREAGRVLAKQNAVLVRNAERYYRAMFGARARSWNLRDTHMVDTSVTRYSIMT